MNEDDLKRLLGDVVECDANFDRARKAAWERVERAAQNSPETATFELRLRPGVLTAFTRQPQKAANSWRFLIAAACTALLLSAILVSWRRIGRRNESPVSTEGTAYRISVEIVSTKDLPRGYVEIDDATLRKLFPHGIVVAYGEHPQILTFEQPDGPTLR